MHWILGGLSPIVLLYSDWNLVFVEPICLDLWLRRGTESPFQNPLGDRDVSNSFNPPEYFERTIVRARVRDWRGRQLLLEYGGQSGSSS